MRLGSWVLLALLLTVNLSAREKWSPERARAWYEAKGWLAGANFTASTAINQLEMWQEDTFDPETIDRELGWAASLGFNSMRVFTHHLLWEHDRDGFLRRFDWFLRIAESHGIGVMVVPLDGVWDPLPRVGTQREPRPHVHNSGWVQSPGAELLGDPLRHDELRPYIYGLATAIATTGASTPGTSSTSPTIATPAPIPTRSFGTSRRKRRCSSRKYSAGRAKRSRRSRSPPGSGSGPGPRESRSRPSRGACSRSRTS